MREFIDLVENIYNQRFSDKQQLQIAIKMIADTGVDVTAFSKPDFVKFTDVDPYSKGAAGVYDPINKRLIITDNSYDLKYAIIIHEYGHHIHYTRLKGFKNVGLILRYMANHFGGDWPSKYSRMNHREFFAELFLFFVADDLSDANKKYVIKLLKAARMIH